MASAIDNEGLEWMPKTVWGPIKWKELHTRGLIRRGMSRERKWFKAFVAGLPCEKCREHFRDFVWAHPPDFRTRPRFFSWGVKAHNHVNRHTGKGKVSVATARKLHRFSPDPK